MLLRPSVFEQHFFNAAVKFSQNFCHGKFQSEKHSDLEAFGFFHVSKLLKKAIC